MLMVCILLVMLAINTPFKAGSSDVQTRKAPLSMTVVPACSKRGPTSPKSSSGKICLSCTGKRRRGSKRPALGFHATAGSAEAYHDRLRLFTRALRANAQDVTLWVWAAQFDGFGWVDPSVTYAPSAGRSAFDDPAVRATFEKYYDGYAELAPDVDLLITHFYDPGMLKDRADVFAYAPRG